MNKEKNVFKLKGKVQHYAWGGHSFIPHLLSVQNTGDKPFAEYWLGAHMNAPSEMVIGNASHNGASAEQVIPLDQYIKAHPAETLGSQVAEAFGKLPYLLKILDVKDMLSIQVHPSRQNAVIEFEAENKRGVALNAPDRNYKDDNHKPELMLALSEFWLLHGFKPADKLKRTLSNVPELDFLLPVFKQKGYQELYRQVMEMDQAEVNRILQPLLDRIIPAYESDRLSMGQEDFWAARAALTFNEPGRIDRGIFSIYLFNLVNLHPGEAIFQDAGLPHAYLEGHNVEIMANSDNVLRGGLTPKHIDVPELLKHVKFEETIPAVIEGDEGDEDISVFYTPAPDFELARIKLAKGHKITAVNRSVGIFIVLEGTVQVTDSSSNAFERHRGEAFVAFDQAKLSLEAVDDAIVYMASVPV
jgi:mannose-6-phosphate isomerase